MLCSVSLCISWLRISQITWVDPDAYFDKQRQESSYAGNVKITRCMPQTAGSHLGQKHEAHVECSLLDVRGLVELISLRIHNY